MLVYGDGNEITFIPSTVFFVFPSMEEFSIPGPNLEFSVLNTKNFVDALNLKKLRIENTAVSKLSANLFVHAPILQKIILKNNWIDDVDQLAFKGLNQLQEISLSGNRIKYLHAEVFSGLKSLVGLQLIKNICINKSFYIDEGNLNEVEDEIKRSCAHQEVQFKARIFESNTTKHNHLNFNETLYEILEHKSDTIEETIATDKGSTDNDVMAIFITLGVLILILMPSIIIMVSLINNREPPISQTPRPSVPQIIMEDILLKDMEDPLAFY